jgi:2-haloacid dehalogenase
MAGPVARACVFDAYGTLFDVASAAEACRDELGDKTEAVTRLWREKQLQYTWLRTMQGLYVDLWQVTGDGLDYALEAFGAKRQGLWERLMSLYLTLTPFPDVADCLRRLKSAGVKTAILSNGPPRMLEPLVAAANLGGLLDQVLSVDTVKVFKTHPKVYQLAVDRLGVDAGAIVFVSSNGWDAYAASAFGMRVAWCNRYGQPPERLPGRPNWEMASLAELPELLLGGAA